MGLLGYAGEDGREVSDLTLKRLRQMERKLLQITGGLREAIERRQDFGAFIKVNSG